MNFCVQMPFETPEHGTELVIFTPSKRYMQEWEAKTFVEKASAYAVNNSVYVLVPMFSLNDFLAVCLVDPQGKAAGIQRAHRLSPENAVGHLTAEKLKTFDTPIGRFLITVDVDIYDPELTATALEEKCNAILALQYIPDLDFSKERILFGAWRASQQTGLPVINVSNQGHCVTEACKSAPENGKPNGFASPFDDSLPFYFTLT